MKKSKEEKIGEFAAIGHMILDGFWPVGAAYGTQVLNIPPVELLGLATFISSLFFLAITIKKKQTKQLFSWNIIKGCSLYTAGMLLPYATIFYAAKFNSAMTTALLTQSEIIFAALVGWLLLKEKVQATRLLGISSILATNLVVLYDGDLSINPSSLVLLLVPVVFVFANAVAKKLQAGGLSYAPLLLFRGAVGGSALLVLSAALENPIVPPTNQWLFLLGFGVLAFGIPKALWQVGLNKIDLSKLTAIGFSYPAFSFIFAYFWLGEIPTVYQILALALSFCGVFFLMKSSSRNLAELGAPTT